MPEPEPFKQCLIALRESRVQPALAPRPALVPQAVIPPASTCGSHSGPFRALVPEAVERRVEFQAFRTVVDEDLIVGERRARNRPPAAQARMTTFSESNLERACSRASPVSASAALGR